MSRKVLNIKWPNVLKNDEVYRITNVVKWSRTIRKRRLSWLGHLLRLDEGTAARIALQEACKIVKGTVGRHKLTWIELIKKDLCDSRLNINQDNDTIFFKKLAEVSKDRLLWKEEVEYILNNVG